MPTPSNGSTTMGRARRRQGQNKKASEGASPSLLAHLQWWRAAVPEACCPMLSLRIGHSVGSDLASTIAAESLPFLCSLVLIGATLAWLASELYLKHARMHPWAQADKPFFSPLSRRVHQAVVAAAKRQLLPTILAGTVVGIAIDPSSYPWAAPTGAVVMAALQARKWHARRSSVGSPSGPHSSV